jgi:hypothetical protein
LGVALYSAAGGNFSDSGPSGFAYGVNGSQRDPATPNPKSGTGIGSAGAGGLFNSNVPGPDIGGAGTPGFVIVEEFY